MVIIKVKYVAKMENCDMNLAIFNHHLYNIHYYSVINQFYPNIFKLLNCLFFIFEKCFFSYLEFSLVLFIIVFYLNF